MITGSEIVWRIKILMRASAHKTATELGQLLGGSPSASSQAKRHRYGALLHHLSEEKIIRELRIVARYLGVPIEYLLLGDMDSAPSETSSGDVEKRLQILTVQLEKAMKKLEYFQSKELKKPSDQ